MMNGSLIWSVFFLLLACDRWSVLPRPDLHHVNRFGHSAVLHNRYLEKKVLAPFLLCLKWKWSKIRGSEIGLTYYLQNFLILYVGMNFLIYI